MERTSPFDALNDPALQLGQSALLHELGNWKLLPKGAPGEPEMAADLLGLRLVANVQSNPWGTYYGLSPAAPGRTVPNSPFPRRRTSRRISCRSGPLEHVHLRTHFFVPATRIWFGIYRRC